MGLTPRPIPQAEFVPLPQTRPDLLAHIMRGRFRGKDLMVGIGLGMIQDDGSVMGPDATLHAANALCHEAGDDPRPMAYVLICNHANPRVRVLKYLQEAEDKSVLFFLCADESLVIEVTGLIGMTRLN